MQIEDPLTEKKSDRLRVQHLMEAENSTLKKRVRTSAPLMVLQQSKYIKASFFKESWL